MSTRFRRSARIASASKTSTESPAPQQLASVVEAEANETKEADNIDKTDETNEDTQPNKTPKRSKRSRSSSSHAVRNAVSSPVHAPSTPSTAAPPKLAMSEMHPSKAHQTMAPPSSGLRNGFTDIDYSKTPMQTLLQNTPSKTPVPSSDFTFRYVRPGATDSELGPDARKLMEEMREKAVAIKAQLTAERARELAEEKQSAESRKIAEAKGKSTRFSAAHIAEFKKMDSIEGHPSSFRATPGRFTPVKATTPTKLITPLKQGIKRSQSKAELDEPESSRSKIVRPQDWARSAEKKQDTPENPSKRVRQHIEDDASTLRPVPQDATSIPRPKSSNNDSTRSAIPRSQTMNSLMTPTKSSLARSLSTKTSTVSLAGSSSQSSPQKVNSFSAKAGTSLLRSPSKTDVGALARSPSKISFGGLKMWAAKSNPDVESSSNVPTQVETPGRFSRLKSILKRNPSETTSKSAIPQPFAAVAKTPSQSVVTESMFPAVPLTTPGQKHARRVDFTPETKRMAMAQDSPSPVKSSIPKSTPVPKLPAPKFVAGGGKADSSKKSAPGDVTYPDLSAYEVEGDEAQPPAEPVPSTFTFRSDHTICFENSPPKGFGSAAGQSSIRPVRKSSDTPEPIPEPVSGPIPGSFPTASELSPNKENNDPLPRNGIAHGIPNKKRHRAGSDDDEAEEDEGAKRGQKKLRKNIPAVPTLSARKLAVPISPVKQVGRAISRTPSPQKKSGGMSLSRLQLLAQPKIRK